jgi:hypothetical protein
VNHGITAANTPMTNAAHVSTYPAATGKETELGRANV